MKFNWNTSSFVCLCIAFGCFLCQNRDWMAHTAVGISYLALYGKTLLIPDAVLFR